MYKRLIINGRAHCYRCGVIQNSDEHRYGPKCAVWGKVYPKHMFAIYESLEDRIRRIQYEKQN